jgi:hypothetical protein
MVGPQFTPLRAPNRARIRGAIDGGAIKLIKLSSRLSIFYDFDALFQAARAFKATLIVIRIVWLNCNEPCRRPAAFTAGRCQ